MKIDVPIADVADRITILRLKIDRLHTEAARQNAARELLHLSAAWSEAGLPPLHELSEARDLAEVNDALWQVEDALRDHEARGDFGAPFVEKARSVYRLNDRRAALKRSLNLRLGSPLIEEKSYAGDSR